MDDVIMYTGKDQRTVDKSMSDPLHYEFSWSTFKFDYFGQTFLNLNPFQSFCFGFKTDNDFEVYIDNNGKS